MYNVYLCQPAHATLFDDVESYWLPYSVGCLWSYAIQNVRIQENFCLKELIFKRDSISDTINLMENPSVAAFSCYVWNFEYCKKLAEAIKNKWPNCLIIFGGPQVTKRPYEQSFFLQHPYVDTIVNGEGEPAFLEILLSHLDNAPIKKISTFARMDNLDYPSPYTSGVFDKIVKDNPNYHWQAVLETNRGCPYNCTFCDWGSLTYAKVLKFAEDRVLDEITWISNNQVSYLFIADANYGIFYERDKKFAQYLNQLQITNGFPKVVIAQWAKNAKHQVLEIAKIFFNGSKNRGFTVSVQSMNEVVLDAVKRKNMQINDLKEMLEECVKNNVPSYTEMILGLPYETYETWRENHGIILEAGQHNILDVWLTQLLENSELNTHEQRSLHNIQSVAVPKHITGVISNSNDVLEQEILVKSTKYMPFDDMIKSYLFSYIVMTYHYGGWTHVLSRFLRKYKNINYKDFYSNLEESIIHGSPDSLLTKEYNRLGKFVTSFLLAKDDCDPDMLKESHNILWCSLIPLHDNQEQVFDEIFKIINEKFCALDKEMYDELKSLQINYLYKYGKQYPYSIDYNYNIYNYIFNNSDIIERKNTLTFTYPFVFAEKKRFLEKVYFGRRAGIMKTRIELTT